jgi:hypothetical protein
MDSGGAVLTLLECCAAQPVIKITRPEAIALRFPNIDLR